MTSCEKTTMVAGLLVKFTLLLGLLYFFVCSLSFLGDAFRLLGGESPGQLQARLVLCYKIVFLGLFVFVCYPKSPYVLHVSE